MSLDFNEFSADSPEKWRARIEKELKGKPFENLVWNHTEDFQVEPNQSFKSDNKGVPGKFPYLRGVKTQTNNWEIAQFIPGVDEKLMNRLALESLAGGAEELVMSVKDSLDLTQVLEGVFPNFINLRFLGEFSEELLLQLVSICNAKKINHTAISGSTELHLYTPKLELRADQLKLALKIQKTFPNLKPVTVRGEYFHDLGALDSLEMACALAIGHESFLELVKAGMDTDSASAGITFTLGTGSSYFTQIAKFRAFRQLWALVLSKYQFEHRCSTATHIQGFTSNWNKTALDQENNLLRTTTEAMSAILGGADSVCVFPFNELTKETSSSGMRYARNIQHLLKSESFLNQTLDPAGGSYYIENLTQELREKAWDKFCHIEENGGINELHKNGEILKMIQADAAVQKDTLMAENKIMVGVNRHKPDTHSEVISKDNRLAKEFES